MLFEDFFFIAIRISSRVLFTVFSCLAVKMYGFETRESLAI